MVAIAALIMQKAGYLSNIILELKVLAPWFLLHLIYLRLPCRIGYDIDVLVKDIPPADTPP